MLRFGAVWEQCESDTRIQKVQNLQRNIWEPDKSTSFMHFFRHLNACISFPFHLINTKPWGFLEVDVITWKFSLLVIDTTHGLSEGGGGGGGWNCPKFGGGGGGTNPCGWAHGGGGTAPAEKKKKKKRQNSLLFS